MSTKDYKHILDRVDKVIQVNVMTADEGDFLATHMPFEHLEVTESGLEKAQTTSMSEEQVYDSLIKGAGDEHHFIIVKGHNGAGKSHLIRWFQARMTNDVENGVVENEKIVFIRRIDNTLRGAIQQLLEQGVVTDPHQLQVMRGFLNSVTNMSEAQLKDSIHYSFVAILREEAEAGKIPDFRSTEALGYAELLNCDPFRRKLQEPQGPISRFFELISKPSKDTVNAGTPHFEVADFNFEKDRAFLDAMKEYQSVFRINTALHNLMNKDKAQKLTDVLNRYAETVIQRAANIGGTNVAQVMTDLRKDLKKQGKNLTIFIEDMTTFTGVDTDLIKILVEGNTGEYKDLCRITSVIGITNAYYDERFKGNFKDRVTHQVLVDQRSFGDPETLYSMAALYLNACYLTDGEVESWLKEGAWPEALPYRVEEPPYEWDRVDINGRSFSLFPFTKRSLSKLLARIKVAENRTPRNFLRAVVKEQFVTYLLNQQGEELFPSVTTDAVGSDAIEFVSDTDDQQYNVFVQAAKDKEEKKAFRALLCFWGNATFAGDEKTLAGLPGEFIHSLHYSFLDGKKLPEDTGTVVTPKPKEDPDKGTGLIEPQADVFPAFPQGLQDQLNDISQWNQDADYTLQTSHILRSAVASFLRESVDWPMEGVPTYWAELYLRNNLKVYIENQKESVPTEETALIVLKRSPDVAYVLKGLAIRETMKNWHFKDSAFYQQKIAVWLEKNKREYVRRIANKDRIVDMQELLMASMTAEFIHLAVMGGLNQDEARLKEKLFRQKNDLQVTERGKDKRGNEWGKLIEAMSAKMTENRFADNKEILTRMIKSTTGVAQTTSDNVTVWGAMVDSAYKAMCKAHWDFSPWLAGKDFSSDDPTGKPYRLLQDYLPDVAVVLEDEKRNFELACRETCEYVENPEDPNCWREVVKESTDFLHGMQANGLGYPGEFDVQLTRVKITADTLAGIVKNGKKVCAANQPSAMLAFFSRDPVGMELRKALNAFDQVREYAEQQKRKHEEAMKNLRQEDPLGSEVGAVKEQITAMMEILGQEVE